MLSFTKITPFYEIPVLFSIWGVQSVILFLYLIIRPLVDSIGKLIKVYIWVCMTEAYIKC